MRKFNKAFTLGEVLIVMVIIGIIMSIAVKTIKMVKSSYTPLTYSAFNTIKDVANILTGTSLASSTTDETIVDGQKVRLLKSDSSLICNKIVNDIVNSSGRSTACANIYAVNSSGTEPVISGINLSKPSFTTTNGMRYYLTNHVAAISGQTQYGFRLIAVDLNGASSPNITEAANNVPPDVVTFMLMDNGDVYPLGVAADNIELDGKKYSYINSAVKGYCYPNSSDSDSDGKIKPIAQWHCPLSDGAYYPPDCRDGQKCSYLIEKPIQPQTYRQAYCTVQRNININDSTNAVTYNIPYEAYCNTVSMTSFRGACPPFGVGSGGVVKRFDRCDIELVKPMFRFNLR